MTELLIEPLVDSFMEIGVLVSVMLLLIGLARLRWGTRWDGRLVRHRKAGPVVAALLSIPPGCSGVLATVSLYGRNLVTFGTVVAALSSTMGDSAWVLLAADFRLAVGLKLTFVVVGSALGFIVDALHIAPRKITERTSSSLPARATASAVRGLGEHGRPDGQTSLRSRTHSLDTRGTPDADIPFSGWTPRAGWKRLGACCFGRRDQREPARGSLATPVVVFWSAVAAGVFLRVPVELRLVDEDTFGQFGHLDPYVLIGAIGGVCALVVAFQSRRAHQCLGENDLSFRGELARITRDASATITLVGLAYALWAVLSSAVGFEAEQLSLHGAGGVALAAVLALLPSCGLEVVIAGLFTTGAISFPVLLTYLLAHDGAGLVPLFAIHRKSAMLAAVITTIPALAIGLVVYVCMS